MEKFKKNSKRNNTALYIFLIILIFIVSVVTITLIAQKFGVEESNKVVNSNFSFDEIKAWVLDDADVDISEVTFAKDTLELKSGTYIYEAEFSDDVHNYFYEYNISDNYIVSKGMDTIDIKGTYADDTQNDDLLTIEQVKSIALNDVGLNESDVMFVREYQRTKRSVQVYDIRFKKESSRYNYIIKASTGEIIEFEWDN